MSVDIFMKIDGLEGESIDATHGKEISVLSWSWGASQSGSTHIAVGGGSGKVSVQDLSFTKYVDSTSHQLLLNCCNGKHIKEAILTVRKAGGDAPVDYVTLTMTDIIVSSVSTGGSAGGDMLTENISLNFAKFKFEYRKQKKDGTADAPLPAGWDMQKNEKV